MRQNESLTDLDFAAQLPIAYRNMFSFRVFFDLLGFCKLLCVYSPQVLNIQTFHLFLSVIYLHAFSGFASHTHDLAQVLRRMPFLTQPSSESVIQALYFLQLTFILKFIKPKKYFALIFHGAQAPPCGHIAP